MNDVLDDINDYNKNRDKKVLIVFDDMIADIEYNKNFKRIIKELFYRARKINVSIVFTTQSYFRALKDARLNSTHYILMKIGNKKELKRTAEEKSGHLDCKDFLKIYNYLSDCNWTRTHNHLVHKLTLNHRVWIHSETRT